MSTTPIRRGARTRAGTVEQVVFATVERLLAEGETFTGLGVQRIAEEAGIARSTFYVHFEDKNALLMRLAESATSGVFTEAERWVREEDPEGLTSLERQTRTMLAQHRRHAPALKALAEVAAYDREVAEFWRAKVDHFAGVLRERLERGQARGEVPAELDPEVTSQFVAWGTERIVAVHIAVDDGSGDDRLADGIARALWTTLHPPGAK